MRAAVQVRLCSVCSVFLIPNWYSDTKRVIVLLFGWATQGIIATYDILVITFCLIVAVNGIVNGIVS